MKNHFLHALESYTKEKNIIMVDIVKENYVNFFSREKLSYGVVELHSKEFVWLHDFVFQNPALSPFLKFLNEQKDFESLEYLLSEYSNLNLFFCLHTLNDFSHLSKFFVQEIKNKKFNPIIKHPLEEKDWHLLNALDKEDCLILINHYIESLNIKNTEYLGSQKIHTLWKNICESPIFSEQEIINIFPFFYETSNLEMKSPHCVCISLSSWDLYKNSTQEVKKAYNFSDFQESMLEYQNLKCDIKIILKFHMKHIDAFFKSDVYGIDFLQEFSKQFIHDLQSVIKFNLEETILKTKSSLENKFIQNHLDLVNECSMNSHIDSQVLHQIEKKYDKKTRKI